jgi:glycosyltransferase involved in cell wall biosynthesis
MENKSLKILEICPYSSGICGVWIRVYQESLEFSRSGYRPIIFSSDRVKGTNEKAPCEQQINDLKIKRFLSKNTLISKNVHYFNFEKELKELIDKKQVDLVITHLLHPHSFKSLKICLKNNIPCYLVTHAPFNIKRKFPLNLATSTYNNIRVRPLLKKFTKIIAVTKWEYFYLEKLGISKEKIIHIPNGIPPEFYTKKKTKASKDVLFLGRIAPVKNLEDLIEVGKLLPEINFSIVGPSEKRYLSKLRNLIKINNLTNIELLPPIYDLKKKIALIDSHKIFVLPSKREAMPQVLLEAMARQKIVISSDTDGGKEIIKNNENGFLYPINDSKKLADLIKDNISGNKKIQENAQQEAKKYSWRNLIKLYISLFTNDKHNNHFL